MHFFELYLQTFFYIFKKKDRLFYSCLLFVYSSVGRLKGGKFSLPAYVISLEEELSSGNIKKFYSNKKKFLVGAEKHSSDRFGGFYRVLCALIDGDYSQYLANKILNKYRIDKKDLVHGDKVLHILGPLFEGDYFSANDCDDYLYIKPKISWLEKHEGRALCYYNSEDSSRLSDEISLSVERKLVRSVVTTNSELSIDGCNCEKIIFTSPSPVFQPTAIVNILVFAYLSGYKKISLTGFTFYVGERLYRSNYSSSLGNTDGQPNKDKFLKSMVLHDPLINFNAVKSLLLFFSDVELDPNLRNIMSMDSEGYLNAFKKFNL